MGRRGLGDRDSTAVVVDKMLPAVVVGDCDQTLVSAPLLSSQFSRQVVWNKLMLAVTPMPVTLPDCLWKEKGRAP